MLFLSVAMLPLALSAVDLHVAMGGTGSIHPNIGSAIAAAANGDRILVQPGVYPAFTVDRSVEIHALSPISTFTVAGGILILAINPIQVTLTGADVQGTLVYDPVLNVSSIPITLHISGCSFTAVELVGGSAYLNMFDCTIHGSLSFARGTVTGCRINGEAAHMAAGASVLSLTSGSSPAGTLLHRYVVGNIIGSGLSASFLPNVVTLETDAPYTLANNFIHGSASPNAKPAVKKKKPKEVYLQVTLVDCIISSWSLRVPGGGQVPWLEDSVSMFEPAFTCLLHNNHIVGTLPFIGNALNFPQLYNVVSPSLGGMDPVTGSPTTGSMAIDAGDPSTAFLDLDLTRNDAGCTGGSWAISNFQGPSTAARIGVVHAPRTTAGNATLTISATGNQR